VWLGRAVKSLDDVLMFMINHFRSYFVSCVPCPLPKVTPQRQRWPIWSSDTQREEKSPWH